MTSKRTLGRVGLCVAAVAGAVLTPAAAASAAPAEPTTPGQEGEAAAYDGRMEEANAWALDMLNLPAAHETTRGEGVTVAVIDTGMSNHPFFEDKDVLPGFSTLGDEEDAWYDVSPDDPAAPQYDGPEVMDKRGHGTMVTGVALMAAPEATILPIRDGDGVEDGFSNLALGAENQAHPIRLAVDNGAEVISMSYDVCCGEAPEDMMMAVQYAIDHDVVLVAAAGNDPESNTNWQWPAAIPGVVTASGLGTEGEPWEQSTIGPTVDVAAPADWAHVLPNPQSRPDHGDPTLGDYDADIPLYNEEMGGTSFAAPWVSGIVALIRAAHPDLDANGVIQRLIETTGDQGAEGRDDAFGFGIPDAAAAVTADVEPVDRNPLGYPLGVAGASGEDVSGEPAPGTGATPDGAANQSDEGEESALVPFVVVVLAAVVLGGGVAFLLHRRSARSRAQHGGQGRPAPTGSATTGVLVTVVVALIASVGAYVGADTVIGKSEPADSGEEAADDDVADAEWTPGELAADGNAPAIAAQAWQDAYTAGDLEAFRSLTCENPWYRVQMNVMKLEDPTFTRAGFAILAEGAEGADDWQADDYALLRQSDDKAWVQAGDLSIGSGPTYEIALIREAGEWKVCDFWFTGVSSWETHPEFVDRFPRAGEEPSEVPT